MGTAVGGGACIGMEVRRWSSVGWGVWRKLDSGRTWRLLEDRIISKTFSLALLAIATGRMSFVALEEVGRVSTQPGACGALLGIGERNEEGGEIGRASVGTTETLARP